MVLSWSHYVAMPYVGGVGILGMGTAAWFLFACGSMVWAALSGVGATPADHWVRRYSLAGPMGPYRVDRETLVGVRTRLEDELRR
jgi:hypothetical protein